MLTPECTRSGEGLPVNPTLAENVATHIWRVLHYYPNRSAAAAALTTGFDTEANQYPPKYLSALFTLLPPPPFSYPAIKI